MGPVVYGGGPEATQKLIITILKLFNLPFNHQVYDNDVDEISLSLTKTEIIYLTLNSLKFLGAKSISIGVTLISKLVFSTKSSK